VSAAKRAANLVDMDKTFRAYSLDQRLLLPPDMREWLPDGDLALFISDVVDELDLAALYRAYEHRDGRGQPAYHPAMMVKLLLYGYCTGLRSSRKIERATYCDVAFRVLAADQHPDHDSIAEFRKRHLEALAGVFVQVLRLCQRAGLVKLGHVALDGTKVKANASKHKAMSYARMTETEARLEAEVRALLTEAEQLDVAEDAEHGRGRRGDELPAELARRESRLAKIREAKAALELEAKGRAAEQAEAGRIKLAAREHRVGSAKGPRPKIPDPEQAQPTPTAQRNFTDPESRIMKDGATKEFVQAYNGQIAVDGQAQIIVACAVTQAAADAEHFVPLLQQIATHMGERPAIVTADAGYFSEDNLTAGQAAGSDCFVPPDRLQHRGQAVASPSRQNAASETMRAKLQSETGRAIYALRKTIVEPVFGQIKEVRGLRRFLLRGLQNVTGEWTVICLTHNLLKLFRARTALAPA
jgi:transposase